MLALVMITLYAVPALAVEATLDYYEPNLYMRQNHSFDKGIIDGGTYYLRNVSNGQRMDVDGGFDVNGTSIHTYYDDHGGANQQFRFHYIGNGLYEIVPAYTSKRLHISAEHNLIIYDKNWNSEQKFRLQMVSSNVVLIFSQHGNFTRTVTWDSDNPQCVVNKLYNDLSDKTHAQWQLEPCFVYGESYSTYYIRNANTGHYLDVLDAGATSGTLIRGTTYFHGSPNQEWKFRFDSTDGTYNIMPGHRRDMAMDDRWEHMGIANGDAPSTQKFCVNIVSTDTATGKIICTISTPETTGRKYLKIGNNLGDNYAYKYVDMSDSADRWILEEVAVDAKHPVPLNAVNSWYNGTTLPGYNEVKYFTFLAPQNSRYKIELSGNATTLERISSATDNMIQMADNGNQYGVYYYHPLQVMDVFLKAGTTYQVAVSSSNDVSESFSIRIRQMSFVGHSCNEGNLNTADFVIDAAEVGLGWMNYNIEHRTDMTTDAAETSTSSLTGYRDFNAEVFIYAGHGTPGYARYDGGLLFGRFDADDLPDMSNCELVIWACCESDLPNSEHSLAQASIARGAKTVIAWDIEVNGSQLEIYLRQLFINLYNGNNVLTASNNALAVLTSKINENIEGLKESEVSAFIAATEIRGSQSNILYPSTNSNITAIDDNAVSSTTTLSVEHIFPYVMIAEDKTAGAKMYAKMTNGTITGDYYVEICKDGVVTQVHKAPFSANMGSAIQIIGELQKLLLSQADEMKVQYQLRCIGGELYLIEQRAVTDVLSDEYVFYNVLTGEVIQ